MAVSRSAEASHAALTAYVATLSKSRVDEDLLRRPARVHLEVLEGADVGRRFVLAHERSTAGRGEGHDIVLQDPSVSSTHFELQLDERGVLLRDLGSTNGTWIGRVQVLDRALLTEGADFYAGDCRLRLLSVEEGEVAVSKRQSFGRVLGESRAMRELFAHLQRLAKTPLNVMIQGETGTGKGLLAKSLHEASDRANGPFVVFDCTMVPRELAEAQIMGHRKGAFTGAVADQRGCFEQADGGTLFIDEIGELPLELQAKLLRVVEEQEVQRIGEEHVRKVDVRVVAATNRDLRRMVADQAFRLDLHERLAYVTLFLPPLRDRPEDVAMLGRAFVEQFGSEVGRTLALTDDAVAWLQEQPWPGNVRTLRNTIQVAAYLSPEDIITRQVLARTRNPAASDAPLQGAFKLELPAQVLSMTLKDGLAEVTEIFQRVYCERLMERTGGDIGKAAATADYSRRWLVELLKRFGLYSA